MTREEFDPGKNDTQRIHPEDLDASKENPELKETDHIEEGPASGDGGVKREKKEANEKKAVFPAELAAGFWLRFFAFIIDSLVAGALSSIIIDGPLTLMGVEMSNTLYLPLKSLAFVLYFFLFNLFSNGQTLGKMILGLRVVRMDGKKLSALDIFIREFVGRYIHTYSFLPLAYVVTGFTAYKQNLLDYFADTTVINLSKLEIYEKYSNPA